MKKIIIVAAVAFFIVSCQSALEKVPFSNETETSEYADMSSKEGFVLDEYVDTQPSRSVESKKFANGDEKGSKILKEGTIRIEVDDLITTKKHIDLIVQENNGYYENEILKNSDFTQKYNLKIRIPSVNFNAVVDAVEEGKGEVFQKDINARDVTEEYLDLEIRITNNQAYLKKYTQLLNKAESIKDIIEIQEKIRQIELLIDGNNGRIRYLGDRVDYSTLTIELIKKQEEIIATAPPTFFQDIKDAFKNGFSGVLLAILLLANLWSILFILILFWMLRKKMFSILFKKEKVIQ